MGPSTSPLSSHILLPFQGVRDVEPEVCAPWRPARSRSAVSVAGSDEGAFLRGQGNPQHLRALLVGVGRTTLQIQTILRQAGVALEVAGSPGLATPSVWRLDLDVILVSLSPLEQRFLDAVRGWRRAGLATPLLA